MITLKKISFSEIEKYVSLAFAGDTDLIEKYHFSDKTLPDTISNNVKNIMEMKKIYPIQCYSVNVFGNEIGFTVANENLLYSFGINKEYRTKEIVLGWWQEVRRMTDDFVCCLYPENTRAINFFVRNGMEISSSTNENVTLIYKHE